VFLIMAIAPHKNKNYALYLFEWRKARGLTGAELAERTGYDQGTISALESGSRRANLDHLFAIAKVLELSVPQLFRSPDDPLNELDKAIADLSDGKKAQALKVLSAFLEPSETSGTSRQ